MKKILVKYFIVFVFIIVPPTRSQDIDSLATIIESDTTLVIKLSNTLETRVDIKIQEHDTIGTIYNIYFESNSQSKIKPVIDTVRSYWGVPEIKFVDLTFDGYLDFTITEDRWPVKRYKFYIYNSSRRRFVLCKTCDDLQGEIEIDRKNRKLHTYELGVYAKEIMESTSEFIIKNGFPFLKKTTTEKSERDIY